jgi:hypothetical protein
MNPKLRILLVDDDQRMTSIPVDILSIAGHGLLVILIL